MKTEITALDLRIDNWVSSKRHKGLFTQIHTVMPNSVRLWCNPLATGYKFDEIEGILITPEIMEKAGFVKTYEHYYFNQNIWVNSFGFRIAVDNTENTVNIPHNDCGYYTRLVYLHQLQNLYHSLTGTELKIEL